MGNEKFQFKQFIGYNSIAHGVSTKAFGSMKNSDTLDVDRDALNMFAHSIGIIDDIVCMKQIHSGNVSLVENSSELRIPETDGLITNKKHIPLAILTADCLPLLFYDPEKEAIGVAHAGYRGLLNHIIEHTIKSFVSNFKSDPKDILVRIGPSIEMMCYEVGEELIAKFRQTFPEFEDMFTEKSFDKLRIKKFYLDLRSIAQQSLLKAGILKEHIEIMDICTKCDPEFYSYRGGDGDKRFASVLSLI